MKQFEELTSKELWGLRNEIVLNSLFIADYSNHYNFDEKDVSCFFDGYMSYLEELGEEQNINDIMSLDNEDNLYSWFNCYDDLSWIKTKNNLE